MEKKSLIQDGNDAVNEMLIETMKAVPVKDMIAKALEARQVAYAPYSHYQVGASLLTKDGKIFRGCNVENASYGVSNCAERTAFFKAVSEGYCDFRAIVVIGSPEGHLIDQYAFPCGVCRQVMMEFCDPDRFLVIVAKSESDYKVYALRELLPEGFGPGNLSVE